MYFRLRDIHHTRRLPRRSQEPIYLMEVLQDCLLLSSDAAGINKVKEI